MKKTTNNFGPYKRNCLKIAEEYIDDIELYVSTLAYEVDREASQRHLYGGQLDKMIKEKMDKIRELIALRDKALEGKDMFEL